jgi:protein-disulfide isomerase
MIEAERPLTKAERKAMKKERKQMETNAAVKDSIRNKLVTILVIVGLAALGWWWWNSSAPLPAEQTAKPVDEIMSEDWVLGNPDASVILMEYSDFQCPACAAYRSLIEALHEQYPEQLAIVFRHFPLKSIHPQATLAAQAAEAAGLQGQFWEMHDVLFDEQAAWAGKRNAEAMFMDYAKELGLDENRFREDMKSEAVRNAVETDYRSAMQLRLNSTPSFFLNGERIANPQGVGPFLELIEAQIRAATAAAELEEE